MNANRWIRQMHRWLSIAFTAGVIVNVITLGGAQEPDFRVYLLALIPLALLLLSGLYLFVVPYVSKWGGARNVNG